MAKNTDWDRLSKEPYELDYVFQLALKHKQQLNKAIKTGTAVIDLNNLKQLRRICHAFIKLYSQNYESCQLLINSIPQISNQTNVNLKQT